MEARMGLDLANLQPDYMISLTAVIIWYKRETPLEDALGRGRMCCCYNVTK
jgi:hypothetical protein